MKVDSFYCHVNNGGMTVSLEIDRKNKVPFLMAGWVHFGHPGPQAIIPLITLEQVDGLIRLLEKAKAYIQDDLDDFCKPDFESDRKAKNLMK